MAPMITSLPSHFHQCTTFLSNELALMRRLSLQTIFVDKGFLSMSFPLYTVKSMIVEECTKSLSLCQWGNLMSNIPPLITQCSFDNTWFYINVIDPKPMGLAHSWVEAQVFKLVQITGQATLTSVNNTTMWPNTQKYELIALPKPWIGEVTNEFPQTMFMVQSGRN